MLGVVEEPCDSVVPLYDDIEAVGKAWDELSCSARETLMEQVRACDAAIALIEEYRSPPRHSRSLQTCWRRDAASLGHVLHLPQGRRSKGKKLCLRPSFRFLEVDVQGRILEPRRCAQLIVSSECTNFDEETLEHYRAHYVTGFSLTMVLHIGGKVAREVTQQNILRELKGAVAAPSSSLAEEEEDVEKADRRRLAPRIEVHTHHSIILYGTRADESEYRIVPAAEAHRVVELYFNEGSSFDVASLPAVDATSREVMLTGALERDLVQSVEQPRGIALVFVTPLVGLDEEFEYERLMRELKEHQTRPSSQRREDLARQLKNIVAAECLRMLQDKIVVQEQQPLYDMEASKKNDKYSWAELELWVNSQAFCESKGCPRRSSSLFATLADCAPSLHAQISKVIKEMDPEEKNIWKDDLLLSALYHGFYSVKYSRTVNTALYCHHHHRSRPYLGAEEEERQATNDEDDMEVSAASSWPTAAITTTLLPSAASTTLDSNGAYDVDGDILSSSKGLLLRSNGCTTPTPCSPDASPLLSSSSSPSVPSMYDGISNDSEDDDYALVGASTTFSEQQKRRAHRRHHHDGALLDEELSSSTALAQQHNYLDQLLATADETDEDDDDAISREAEEEELSRENGDGLRGLERLCPRDAAFIKAMRENLSQRRLQYSREEFQNMLLHVDSWYKALEAEPSQDRHTFWRHCGKIGLPNMLSSTLQQLGAHHGAPRCSLLEEIGAVEHWLQQGARSASSYFPTGQEDHLPPQ